MQYLFVFNHKIQITLLMKHRWNKRSKKMPSLCLIEFEANMLDIPLKTSSFQNKHKKQLPSSLPLLVHLQNTKCKQPCRIVFEYKFPGPRAYHTYIKRYYIQTYNIDNLHSLKCITICIPANSAIWPRELSQVQARLHGWLSLYT